jgi:hypothetical protein
MSNATDDPFEAPIYANQTLDGLLLMLHRNLGAASETLAELRRRGWRIDVKEEKHRKDRDYSGPETGSRFTIEKQHRDEIAVGYPAPVTVTILNGEGA